MVVDEPEPTDTSLEELFPSSAFLPFRFPEAGARPLGPSFAWRRSAPVVVVAVALVEEALVGFPCAWDVDAVADDGCVRLELFGPPVRLCCAFAEVAEDVFAVCLPAFFRVRWWSVSSAPEDDLIVFLVVAGARFAGELFLLASAHDAEGGSAEADPPPPPLLDEEVLDLTSGHSAGFRALPVVPAEVGERWAEEKALEDDPRPDPLVLPPQAGVYPPWPAEDDDDGEDTDGDPP